MDIIKGLQDKSDKKACALLQELLVQSAESPRFYKYFDEFLGLLDHESSYVRIRGFLLACAQARWDEGEKLKMKKASSFCLKCLLDLIQRWILKIRERFSEKERYISGIL